MIKFKFINLFTFAFIIMATTRISELPNPIRPPHGLPIITEINYGFRRYTTHPPEFKWVLEISTHKEAVEFRIKTDHPIPVQGTAPALFLGDEMIVDYAPTVSLNYTFFLFDYKSLPDTAAIYWGWAHLPNRKGKTEFLFKKSDMKRF